VPGPITQGEWFLTEQRSGHDCYTTERRISARRAGHYEERFIGRVYEQQDAEFIVAAANAALASLPAPAAPDFQHARAEKWLAAYERTKLRLEDVQALVLALQAHAKEHGWQDYDDPIADLLAWEDVVASVTALIPTP
jgi:hypothetical protein